MNKHYDKFYSMYHKFRGMGLRTGAMENQFALTEFAHKQYESALEAIEYAVKMEPAVKMFQLNKGLILFAMGKKIAAGETFSANPAAKIEGEVYKVARAMAEFERFDQNVNGIDKNKLITSLSEIRNSQRLSSIGIRPFDVMLALVRLRSQL